MRWLSTLLGTLLLAAAANWSPAALVPVDLDASGDALLTRDTVSDLEWLDLTKSVGYSFDAIAAGAGGFRERGFRHATEAELLDVLIQLGFGGFDSRGSQYFLAAQEVIALFGCTSECGIAATLHRPSIRS